MTSDVRFAGTISAVLETKTPVQSRLPLNSVVLASLLGCVASAHAVDFVVDTTGDPGPKGTTSLRQAIAAAAASSGNTVRIGASLIGSTITLAQGAIKADPAYDFAIRGPGSGAVTINAGNTSDIFQFKHPADTATSWRTVTMSGLAMKQGASNFSTLEGGGAIYAYLVNLDLDDVAISGCNSTALGGAIATFGSSMKMSHSAISGNQSVLGGGGISTRIATFPNAPTPVLTISSSTITGNGTPSSNGGGGIRVTGANVYITDTTISRNTTYGFGGGVLATGGNVVRVETSLISGNVINAPRDANDVQGGGGIALAGTHSTATIINSTITGNSTYGPGGGIGVFNSTTGITRIQFSTITNNYAGYGSSSSNGVYADAALISNSIIAGNFNRGNTLDVGSNGTMLIDHSLIQNPGSVSISGSGNIFQQDPQLGELRDNGGPTWTLLPGPTSAAVDSADITSTLSTDQRGMPRHAVKDMGAVERQFPRKT